jgi:PPK2 family polyphosphate:nucleotide phosphotransferase
MKPKAAGIGRPVAEVAEKCRVAPGKRVHLKDGDASRSFGWSEAAAVAATAVMREQLGELQYQLMVDARHAVLLVLQAIDGGGKDSTIHHVCGAFNPQSCTVTAFKAPTKEELAHDFLWRVHAHTPARGDIAVFNRSHYEDVLVVRVDKLVKHREWSARYALINDFERLLVAADTSVVKIFLHISRDEQKRRFEERLANPHKQWKFDPQDLDKRAQWDEYREAFQDMLHHCSTRQAPWYVIPADHKWLRDLVVSQILIDTLQAMKLRDPQPDYDPAKIKVR